MACENLGFLRGVGEASLVPLLFAVLGLAGAELQATPDVPPRGGALYPAEMEIPPADGPPSLWLVDGFNVVSVALLREQGRSQGDGRQGWWRRENRDALVERARGFEDPAAEIWVVFDGADPGGNDVDATPRTVFAASADDWLLARVRAAEAPERVAVVTADRRLVNRVRACGAVVVSPGDFLGRCGGV